MAETEEYKKSCRDELDWNRVDQLHESTLQISNSCFEFKKLCIGLIGIIAAASIKFGDEEISSFIFLISLIISIGFWTCDSTVYYYQKKNRSLMNKIMNDLAARNQVDGEALVAIVPKWKYSFFNTSMVLYYYIVIICLIGLYVQVLVKV